MAKSTTLRFQHLAVATPSETGVLEVYSDTSGVLKSVRPGGDVYFVGQTFTQVLSGNYPGAVATGVTGATNGPFPFNSLGGTTTLFVVQGPSGAKYGIPAYPIV